MTNGVACFAVMLFPRSVARHLLELIMTSSFSTPACVCVEFVGVREKHRGVGEKQNELKSCVNVTKCSHDRM